MDLYVKCKNGGDAAAVATWRSHGTNHCAALGNFTLSTLSMDELEVFVTVVEGQGFSAAARRLESEREEWTFGGPQGDETVAVKAAFRCNKGEVLALRRASQAPSASVSPAKSLSRNTRLPGRAGYFSLV